MGQQNIKQQPQKVLIGDMKKRCEDLLVSVSWGDIASRYFHKSPSWFYHKFSGIDGNGGVGGFTPDEAQQFKGALCDLSERIRRCADAI